MSRNYFNDFAGGFDWGQKQFVDRPRALKEREQDREHLALQRQQQAMEFEQVNRANQAGEIMRTIHPIMFNPDGSHRDDFMNNPELKPAMMGALNSGMFDEVLQQIGVEGEIIGGGFGEDGRVGLVFRRADGSQGGVGVDGDLFEEGFLGTLMGANPEVAQSLIQQRGLNAAADAHEMGIPGGGAGREGAGQPPIGGGGFTEAARSGRPGPTTHGGSTAEAEPDGGLETEPYRLGTITMQSETSGRGAGTISTGEGDHGGKSYGNYQLSSNTGTLGRFLRASEFGEEFKGLQVGSPEFDRKWKELAENPEFAQAQHEFIRDTHMRPQLERLQGKGIELGGRSVAVQEMIWSTSTHFGAHSNVIEKALEGRDVSEMSDAEIINAVQDLKILENETRFSSSDAENRAGTLRRAHRERQQLLELAERAQAEQDAGLAGGLTPDGGPPWQREAPEPEPEAPSLSHAEQRANATRQERRTADTTQRIADGREISSHQGRVTEQQRMLSSQREEFEDMPIAELVPQRAIMVGDATGDGTNPNLREGFTGRTGAAVGRGMERLRGLGGDAEDRPGASSQERVARERSAARAEPEAQSAEPGAARAEVDRLRVDARAPRQAPSAQREGLGAGAQGQGRGAPQRDVESAVAKVGTGRKFTDAERRALAMQIAQGNLTHKQVDNLARHGTWEAPESAGGGTWQAVPSVPGVFFNNKTMQLYDIGGPPLSREDQLKERRAELQYREAVEKALRNQLDDANINEYQVGRLIQQQRLAAMASGMESDEYVISDRGRAVLYSTSRIQNALNNHSWKILSPGTWGGGRSYPSATIAHQVAQLGLLEGDDFSSREARGVADMIERTYWAPIQQAGGDRLSLHDAESLTSVALGLQESFRMEPNEAVEYAIELANEHGWDVDMVIAEFAMIQQRAREEFESGQ